MLARFTSLLLPLALLVAAMTAEELRAQSNPRRLVVVMAHDHAPLFIDPRSVARRGNVIAFSYVLDVRAPADSGPGPWKSNEIEASIDCVKRTVSVRRLTAYPGPRASGTPTAVHSFSAADVKPERITPKSTFAYLEDHLCRAR